MGEKEEKKNTVFTHYRRVPVEVGIKGFLFCRRRTGSDVVVQY